MAPEANPGNKHAPDGPNDTPAKAGWDTVDGPTAVRIDTFARAYAEFLGQAKTARSAVTGLVRVFVDGGGQALPATKPSTEPSTKPLGGRKATEPAYSPGARYYLLGGDGHTAAFVKLGRQPLERGVRMVIASVDAPHIQLKQRPVYTKAGLAMFDTLVHGGPDLRHWLSRPLALHLHLARPGAADGGLDLIVGERPGDPVLVIPDLLPHLSRTVQSRKKGLVDSPERMDAVAARSYRALVEYLSGQGIDMASLAAAESALVPAGPPAFIGVDRALLSGHGHSHRALAYAAVRALADPRAATPEHTAVVVVVRSASRRGGTSGLGFVRTALAQLASAVAVSEDQMDVLATRRMYALSTTWLSSAMDDARTEAGIAISARSTDAVPRATRRVLDSLDAGRAPYQLIGKPPRWGVGRGLAALDMDAVAVAIPAHHRRAPNELISTLDLHYAFQAARAWLIGS